MYLVFTTVININRTLVTNHRPTHHGEPLRTFGTLLEASNRRLRGGRLTAFPERFRQSGILVFIVSSSSSSSSSSSPYLRFFASQPFSASPKLPLIPYAFFRSGLHLCCQGDRNWGQPQFNVRGSEVRGNKDTHIFRVRARSTISFCRIKDPDSHQLTRY